MSNKSSERRSFEEATMELNLTPMMNLISILIPALLVSVVFVEMVVLEVNVPGTSDQADPDQTLPLQLLVTITERGYRVSTSAAQSDPQLIPVVKRSVSCERYVGTLPPPRSANAAAKPCRVRSETRLVWTYDVAALQDQLVLIKDDHPTEHTIIIAAEPDLSYEVITDVMDASRVVMSPHGPRRLFDDVQLRPSL